MNSFFINTTKNLNSKPTKTSVLMDVGHINYDFDSHNSIEKLQEFFPNIISGDFDFKEVFLEDVKKDTLKLIVRKSSTNGSTSEIVLKQNVKVQYVFHS